MSLRQRITWHGFFFLRQLRESLVRPADAEGGEFVQRARHQHRGALQPGGRLTPGVFPERGRKLPDSGQQHGWEDPHWWEAARCASRGQRRSLARSSSAFNACAVSSTVTGASFVVFNGALKASSGFIAKSSIVEGTNCSKKRRKGQKYIPLFVP